MELTPLRNQYKEPKRTNIDRRKHSLNRPQDWQPNDGHAEQAAILNLNLQAERSAFCDFHDARGSTFANWDAAFRTWLRKSSEFRGATKPTAKPSTARQEWLNGLYGRTDDSEVIEAEAFARSVD